jgi:hypothetical protein
MKLACWQVILCNSSAAPILSQEAVFDPEFAQFAGLKRSKALCLLMFLIAPFWCIQLGRISPSGE